ncbi:hypothetical protein ASG60_20670 [Methylobacterium sp. Leaf469]|uniref:hypothetical protein n=1 Tax=Methylobacterium sp. Leaf469 TaxID=1736387 RepID=UPI0006F780EC|nr:hypothetical protein [Methylobacterium sp. Leaf469]KQT96094.1 hypothetical protein ASG60_20670 [Methylobacterium sp. Leaf469]
MLEFDETKPFLDRSEEELWQPYADSHQRAMRDAVVGCCPAAYDEQFQPSSRLITRGQFYRAHEAIAFANYEGCILNVEVTIAWASMGYRYGQEVDRVSRLLMQSIRKFMRRNEVPNFNYMVFERSNVFGLHSHSALHVPIRVYPKFRRWLNRYITRVDRIGYRRRLHVRRRRETDSTRAIAEQWRWFKYCFKGIDPFISPAEREVNGVTTDDTFAEVFGLRHRYSGIVTLPRVRLAQDMQEKSRRQAAYPERLYLIDHETKRYTGWEYERGKSDRLTEMLPMELL